MREYIGKICPFCKTIIQENDNIVICSSCNMPHHLECWKENQGCTTWGCQGTIQGLNEQSDILIEKKEVYKTEEKINKIYCVKCGAPNDLHYCYCEKCGNVLGYNSIVEKNNTYIDKISAWVSSASAEAQNHNFTSANVITNAKINNFSDDIMQSMDNPYETDDEVDFIGVNQAYYMSKFMRLRDMHDSKSWNWSAFFIGPWWFMYRRMYWQAVIIYFAYFFIFFMRPEMMLIMWFIGYVVQGLFGNYFYMKRIEKLSYFVKTMKEPYRTKYIKKNKGTNIGAVVATFFVMFFLFMYTF